MRPSSGGSPIRCRRWRLLWPCLRAGPCDVGCAPASTLTAAKASPVVAPVRLLGGFAGNGRRFRHGSWTSVRFLAGVVRCQLLRPGETPTLGDVSGRFALRNRPEVASGIRLHRKLRILACASVSLVLVAGIAITCHQRPSWRIAVVGVSLVDVAKRTQRCVQIQPWRKPTLFSSSHKLCKTCSLV